LECRCICSNAYCKLPGTGVSVRRYAPFFQIKYWKPSTTFGIPMTKVGFGGRKADSWAECRRTFFRIIGEMDFSSEVLLRISVNAWPRLPRWTKNPESVLPPFCVFVDPFGSAPGSAGQSQNETDIWPHCVRFIPFPSTVWKTQVKGHTSPLPLWICQPWTSLPPYFLCLPSGNALKL